MLAVVASLVFLTDAALTKTTTHPSRFSQSRVELANAVQFVITSKINNRRYRIYLAMPEGSPPPSGYPALYLLDGNMMFPTAATLAAMGKWRGARPAVIVGVGYADDRLDQQAMLRTFDMTPSAPGKMTDDPVHPPSVAQFGGADLFYRFLTEELRPAIAKIVPIDASDQALYGHSLGGLFALRVLFQHPQSFRTFAISSPSIWWNARAVLADEPRLAAAIKDGLVRPRVLIMVDGREQQMPSVIPPGADQEAIARTVAESRMVDNAAELAGRLETLWPVT